MPVPSPLTPVMPSQLASLQLQPNPSPERDEDEECECPDKNPPRPSSKVARVKAFARRMSEWSLENLKRGK